MSEMVEKVARAVGLSLDENRPWEECGSGFREICFDVARAAIEAMRQPTDEMCFAAQRFMEKEIGSSATLQGCAYMAAIDAALKD